MATRRSGTPFSARANRLGVVCFLADEGGQAATEYVLVAGLFVAFIVVAYNTIRESLRDLLSRVLGLLSGPGI
jgi:Flp pilus assembly pilin Flp